MKARSGQILRLRLRKLPEMEALALLLAFGQFMKRVLLACTSATAAQLNIFLPHVSRAPTLLAGLYIDTTHWHPPYATTPVQENTQSSHHATPPQTHTHTFTSGPLIFTFASLCFHSFPSSHSPFCLQPLSVHLNKSSLTLPTTRPSFFLHTRQVWLRFCP